MAHQGSMDQKIRDAIKKAQEQAREQPQISQVDKIRELSREHYEITGAGGGA